MQSVFVLNGRPRVGKDTAIALMIDLLRACGTHGEAFSSIDPVRDMLTAAGFNLSRKTDADRALLASVGDAVERHSQFRTTACLNRISQVFQAHENCAVFIHMREPAMIQRLRGELRYRGVRVKTCLLESDRADMSPTNHADGGVEGMRYDYTIRNDGSIEDLRTLCAVTLNASGLLDQLTLALG